MTHAVEAGLGEVNSFDSVLHGKERGGGLAVYSLRV